MNPTFFSRFKYWINIPIVCLLLISSWSQAGTVDLTEQLEIATSLRLKSRIEELLKEGADPCLSSYSTHLRPLDQAVRVGSIEDLRTLLSYARNCDIHTTTDLGENLVFRAVQYDRTDMLRFLLEQGVSANQKINFNNYTALHIASIAEQVDLLLNYGADLEARGTNGCSPLNSTLGYGWISAPTQLILKGADVNVVCKPDINGVPQYFPLSQAIGIKSPELVKLILEHGADLFGTPFSFLSYLQMFDNTGTRHEQEIKQLMKQALRTKRKIP